MFQKMVERLNFHGDALVLRADRQRLLASNIANADTPGYVARDIPFAQTLREVQGMTREQAVQVPSPTGPTAQTTMTHPRHIPLPPTTVDSERGASKLGYAVQSQPSLDGNTVDLDRERANFVDNAVRYEATLRFINGNAKTMLSAIQGQ